MYQIVKFLSPFADNFDTGKPRPSLVVSPSFGKRNQVILASITTATNDIVTTDMILSSSKTYFNDTGLKNDSVIKLHRLITVEPSQIGEVIGQLPEELIQELQTKIDESFSTKKSIK